MGVAEKAKMVMLHPSEFFERIRFEQGIKKSFSYLATLSLISLVIGILSIVFNITFISPLGLLVSILPFLGQSALLIGIMIPIGIYVLSLVGSFIGAGVVHLFVRLLGGKGKYSDTYKAVTYASTPSLLLGWIPFIGAIFGIYSFYLNLKGLSKLHLISMGRVFVAVFVVPMVLGFVISFLFAGAAYRFLNNSFSQDTSPYYVSCSPCFGSSDFVYISNDDTQMTIKAGPREITVNGTSLDVGETTALDISSCEWTNGDCVVSVSYTIVSSGITHNTQATLHQH